MVDANIKNSIVQSVALPKDANITSDTAIYKYLSIDSFLYLLQYKNLMFSKVTTWPDAFEGSKFTFFQQSHTEDPLADKSTEQFFGSSWTLQSESCSLYTSGISHKKAEDELIKVGSASMWDAYCKNGGVRIKTTVGKVEDILNKQATSEYDCFKGAVVYEAENSWEESISSSGLISKLFIKRVSYRHENEFRFICVDNEIKKKDQIFFNTGELFDFVDEFLIAPMISSNAWKAKMLYQYAVFLSMSPNISGTNWKDGSQYCRISNLYGKISEVIG